MDYNQLKYSKSKYLLSHKDNPIWWRIYNPENIELAVKVNKPIFLSIGYFSCHWCHVMAREVFEDIEVAKILNDNFVCIKVDREENPDVDSFYIQALSVLSDGNAGWPANLFLTPDAKPFFGFTYLPKTNFINITLKIIEIWKGDKEELINYAQKIYSYLISNYLNLVQNKIISENLLDFNLLEKFLFRIDKSIYSRLDERGGFSFRPKFPPHQLLEYLLTRFEDTPSKYVFDCLDRTLSSMISGGMYDVIDGGFCRYSVDENWIVPHFEKMLYDNAYLIYIYTKASKIFENIDYNKSKIFLKVALDSYDFLNNFLREGDLFLSSLSAESNVNGKDQEGAYYLFSNEEIYPIKHDLLRFFSLYDFYNPYSNYGGLILHYKNIPNYEELDSINQIVNSLKQIRKNKTKPYVDNKIILSWNSLLGVYLLKSYQEINYLPFLETSRSMINSLLKNFFVDEKIYRVKVKDEVYTEAVLEDYLWLSYFLYEYYFVTKEYKYYELSKFVFNKAKEIFLRDGVFYNSTIFPFFDIFDNSICSNNSLGLILALLFNEVQNFKDLIIKILNFEDNFLFLGSFWDFLCKYKQKNTSVKSLVKKQNNSYLINFYPLGKINSIHPNYVEIEEGNLKELVLTICDNQKCFQVSKIIEM